jgi:hypothetical protein
MEINLGVVLLVELYQLRFDVIVRGLMARLQTKE